MLSWEGAKAEEMDPYQRCRLWPLKPLVLMGQAAKREERSGVEECVSHGREIVDLKEAAQRAHLGRHRA